MFELLANGRLDDLKKLETLLSREAPTYYTEWLQKKEKYTTSRP